MNEMRMKRESDANGMTNVVNLRITCNTSPVDMRIPPLLNPPLMTYDFSREGHNNQDQGIIP